MKHYEFSINVCEALAAKAGMASNIKTVFVNLLFVKSKEAERIVNNVESQNVDKAVLMPCLENMGAGSTPLVDKKYLYRFFIKVVFTLDFS